MTNNILYIDEGDHLKKLFLIALILILVQAILSNAYVSSISSTDSKSISNIKPLGSSYDAQPLDIEFNPGPPTAGQNTHITVKWINNGPDTISTPLNYWYIKVFVDGSEVYWASLGGQYPPNTIYTNVNFDYTFASAGTHQVSVIVDYYNDLSESNEGNNQYIEIVDVQGAPPLPDLVIEDITFEARHISIEGASDVIIIWYRNAGNANVTTPFNIYAQIDGDREPNCVPFEVPAGALQNCTIYDGLYGGETVTGKIDPENFITESDKTNNQMTVIYGTPNQPPQADFTFSPANPSTSNIVYFTDTSTDSDGIIVGWNWNLGDGTFSTLQNPSHQYNSDGTYTITLTVNDSDGDTGTVSKTVTISEPLGILNIETLDLEDNPLEGVEVNITNVEIGDSIIKNTDINGFVSFELPSNKDYRIDTYKYGYDDFLDNLTYTVQADTVVTKTINLINPNQVFDVHVSLNAGKTYYQDFTYHELAPTDFIYVILMPETENSLEFKVSGMSTTKNFSVYGKIFEYNFCPLKNDINVTNKGSTKIEFKILFVDSVPQEGYKNIELVKEGFVGSFEITENTYFNEGRVIDDPLLTNYPLVFEKLWSCSYERPDQRIEQAELWETAVILAYYFDVYRDTLESEGDRLEFMDCITEAARHGSFSDYCMHPEWAQVKLPSNEFDFYIPIQNQDEYDWAVEQDCLWTDFQDQGKTDYCYVNAVAAEFNEKLDPVKTREIREKELYEMAYEELLGGEASKLFEKSHLTGAMSAYEGDWGYCQPKGMIPSVLELHKTTRIDNSLMLVLVSGLEEASNSPIIAYELAMSGTGFILKPVTKAHIIVSAKEIGEGLIRGNAAGFEREAVRTKIGEGNVTDVEEYLSDTDRDYRWRIIEKKISAESIDRHYILVDPGQQVVARLFVGECMSLQQPEIYFGYDIDQLQKVYAPKSCDKDSYHQEFIYTNNNDKQITLPLIIKNDETWIPEIEYTLLYRYRDGKIPIPKIWESAEGMISPPDYVPLPIPPSPS